MPAVIDFDSTDLLFHFTDSCTATMHILPSGKLRLSPLGRTGDPIEYRFFDIMISGTNLPEFGELNLPWGEAVAAIDRVRREESFVACFCKRYTEFERTHLRCHRGRALSLHAEPNVVAVRGRSHRSLSGL